MCALQSQRLYIIVDYNAKIKSFFQKNHLFIKKCRSGWLSPTDRSLLAAAIVAAAVVTAVVDEQQNDDDEQDPGAVVAAEQVTQTHSIHPLTTP